MNIKTPLSPAQLDRRHKLETLVGVVAYTLVLVASIELLKQGITGISRILLALSPMLPAAFVVWSVFRHITGLDELQRRIQTESLALAAAGTALLGLTYTFLEGSVGFPRLGAWWAWASVGVIWALARVLLRRRYL